MTARAPSPARCSRRTARSARASPSCARARHSGCPRPARAARSSSGSSRSLRGTPMYSSSCNEAVAAWRSAGTAMRSASMVCARSPPPSCSSTTRPPSSACSTMRCAITSAPGCGPVERVDVGAHEHVAVLERDAQRAEVFGADWDRRWRCTARETAASGAPSAPRAGAPWC